MRLLRSNQGPCNESRTKEQSALYAFLFEKRCAASLQARPGGNPEIASAERRVKPLARLLRCATALRVTAPLGCGSRRLVWPKGSLSALHGPETQVTVIYDNI